MGTLFLTRPGQAVLLDSENTNAGLPVTIDGIQGSWFQSFRAILTGLSLVLEGNYQLRHTLKDTIYVYVFGDKVSDVMVSGIAFPDGCTGDQESGLEKVLRWYEANRIAVRQEPIQVQIGTSAAGRFRGHLVGMRPEVSKAEDRLAQFTFFFKVFPGGTS